MVAAGPGALAPAEAAVRGAGGAALGRAPAYVAVGHVTADRQEDGSLLPGGSVTYATAVAAALGWSAGIVTRAASARPVTSPQAGVAYHVVPGPDTTTFANHYLADGSRRQELLAVAPAMVGDDVPAAWRRPEVLHLAPVFREVGPDVAEACAAGFVGLTAQGWLRAIAADGCVVASRWAAPDGLVEVADAVVLSEEDLAGDPACAAWLVGRAPLVVLTRGAGGADAWWRGRRVHQAALPSDVIDPTGAGDSFAAALFVRLRAGSELGAALSFAAAAAAYAIEVRGPGGVPDAAAVARRAAAVGARARTAEGGP